MQRDGGVRQLQAFQRRRLAGLVLRRERLKARACRVHGNNHVCCCMSGGANVGSSPAPSVAGNVSSTTRTSLRNAKGGARAEASAERLVASPDTGWNSQSIGVCVQFSCVPACVFWKVLVDAAEMTFIVCWLQRVAKVLLAGFGLVRGRQLRRPCSRCL